MYIHCNLSNQDTLGTEESVLIIEVSSFQGVLIRGVQLYVCCVGRGVDVSLLLGWVPFFLFFASVLHTYFHVLWLYVQVLGGGGGNLPPPLKAALPP